MFLVGLREFFCENKRKKRESVFELQKMSKITKNCILAITRPILVFTKSVKYRWVGPTVPNTNICAFIVKKWKARKLRVSESFSLFRLHCFTQNAAVEVKIRIKILEALVILFRKVEKWKKVTTLLLWFRGGQRFYTLKLFLINLENYGS